MYEGFIKEIRANDSTPHAPNENIIITPGESISSGRTDLLFPLFFLTIRQNSFREPEGGKMMRTLLPLLLILMSLVSCATKETTREVFQMNLEKYNQLLRWQDFDRAALFSSASVSDKFRERVMAAKGVRITDYQIIDVKYNEKTLEASAVVTFSYYLITKGLLANLTDNQKWAYIEEDGDKAWRLKSLLPEFR